MSRDLNAQEELLVMKFLVLRSFSLAAKTNDRQMKRFYLLLVASRLAALHTATESPLHLAVFQNKIKQPTANVPSSQKSGHPSGQQTKQSIVEILKNMHQDSQLIALIKPTHHGKVFYAQSTIFCQQSPFTGKKNPICS